MENINFSLNDDIAKKTVIFSLKFLCFLMGFSHCKLKTIQIIIKSLVHAVATLNSNMHIKF